MPLSPQQLQDLHKMTKAKIPNWQISGYLMNVCGLSFKEAFDERQKANEAISSNTESSPEQGFGREAEEETPLGERETTSADTEAEEPFQEIEQKEGCISCGDLSLECACEVKTVDQIPF